MIHYNDAKNPEPLLLLSSLLLEQHMIPCVNDEMEDETNLVYSQKDIRDRNNEIGWYMRRLPATTSIGGTDDLLPSFPLASMEHVLK